LKTQKLPITLFIIGIVGISVTALGLSFMLIYFSDYSNNLGTLSTNINAGWSSTTVSDAQVQMWIAPNYFGKDDNLLEIVLRGTANMSGSSNNATFVLLVPFNVRSILDHSNDTEFLNGTWSIQNIGSNASTVYYEIKYPASNLFTPSWGFIDTVVDLRFTHLPSLYNHGSYTVVIPFGGGSTLNVLKSMKVLPSLPLPVDLDKNITFGLLVKGNLALIGSFPAFASQNIAYGLPFHESNESESMLSYNYSPTSPLTITFEDSEQVNLSFLEQALAFTLLGVGIPIIISAGIEFVKVKTHAT
jgi:hypothetical protein